jgi:hypothetical protein
MQMIFSLSPRSFLGVTLLCINGISRWETEERRMNGTITIVKLWRSYAFYYILIGTALGFKNPSDSLLLPSLIFPHRTHIRHQATKNGTA